MENNKGRDEFKNTVKKKITDNSKSSLTDEEIWKRVYARISEDELKENKSFFSRWYGIAAAITILIVASGVYFYLNIYKADFFPGQTYVAKARNTVVTLPDQSIVTMNSSCMISRNYYFENNRSVKFRGEGFFEIAPDEKKPFTIYFSHYKLMVLGTKFNLLSNGDHSEITVAEGSVSVYDSLTEENFVINKDQQLILRAGKSAEVMEVQPENFIFWKTEKINFKKRKLEEVVTILSRKYNLEIRLSEKLKNCNFTGNLSEMNLEESLSLITAVSDCKAERINQLIYLTGKGCD